MDDAQDDIRYSSNPHSLNRSKKFQFYPRPVPPNYTAVYDGEEDDEEDEELAEVDSDEDDVVAGYNRDFNRYPKRQKLKDSVSNYEFVPRSGRSLPSFGGEVASSDWTEDEKFLLLEVWGDRFLQLGRRSLRSDDWVEVAEKVSETLNVKRTECECRQMIDSLKRKYKKEKAKGGVYGGSKWGFFKKMDMLMKPEMGGGGSRNGGFNLACGVDSGEYVFMDTRVYLERANGNDEMRDSPCESEEDEEMEEAGDDVCGGNGGVEGLKILADSVQKFGEIYEKIESSKRDHVMELERMRMEFQRELELQKKQILERTQAEIDKIREGIYDEDTEGTEDEDGDNENDESGENASE